MITYFQCTVYQTTPLPMGLEDTPIKVHWTDNLGNGVHKKLGGHQKIATAQVGDASFQFPTVYCIVPFKATDDKAFITQWQ